MAPARPATRRPRSLPSPAPTSEPARRAGKGLVGGGRAPRANPAWPPFPQHVLARKRVDRGVERAPRGREPSKTCVGDGHGIRHQAAGAPARRPSPPHHHPATSQLFLTAAPRTKFVRAPPHALSMLADVLQFFSGFDVNYHHGREEELGVLATRPKGITARQRPRSPFSPTTASLACGACSPWSRGCNKTCSGAGRGAGSGAHCPERRRGTIQSPERWPAPHICWHAAQFTLPTPLPRWGPTPGKQAAPTHGTLSPSRCSSHSRESGLSQLDTRVSGLE